MRCIVCDNNNWENIDKYRLVPKYMCICTTCGFVSYPSLWKSKEDILKHYRKDYRNHPTHSHLFTGQRKIHFHERFLNETLESWIKNKDKQYSVCEIGAAYGLALQWFKMRVPNSKIYGTELTQGYKRNAYWEFGLNLTDDFDDSLKYDMIMSYKVAEHQMDFDQELNRYYKSLNDDGLLYISVPIWFETMHNFGKEGFDIEYYYDTNHINVWSEKLFRALLKKSGFEIIKEDFKIYDLTLLCKKTTPFAIKNDYENYEEIKEKMNRIKSAFISVTEGRFEEALKIWPNYPNAFAGYAEMNRAQFIKNGWDFVKTNVCEKAIETLPHTGSSYLIAADYAMRMNKYPEAIKYIEDSLKYIPENVGSYHMLINCMRELGIQSMDIKERIHYFDQARKIAQHLKMISHHAFNMAIDYAYLFNSFIPTEYEQN